MSLKIKLNLNNEKWNKELLDIPKGKDMHNLKGIDIAQIVYDYIYPKCASMSCVVQFDLLKNEGFVIFGHFHGGHFKLIRI